jgi:hypothetical protein
MISAIQLRPMIAFLVKSCGLISGGFGLLLVLAGCGTHETPDAAQQVMDTVHSAYLRTTSAGPLTTSVRVLIDSGTDPIAGAEGTATLDLSKALGEANLTLSPGGQMTVVSTRDYLFEGHAAVGAKTGTQWITVNTLQSAQTDPTQLPQIQEPGIDPLQIPTLLDAVKWPGTIVGERPVLIDDSSGNYIDYEITVDTARLAALLPTTARGWLSLMAREPGGKDITLDITIANGRINSVTGDMPVPPPPLPTRRKQVKVPITTPLHAVVGIQFEYSKHAATITVPKSPQQ